MQRLRRSATFCVFGAIGLVSITFACYRLHCNVATAGFLYMIVVVLLSRTGDFVSSILVSVVAVFCLAHLAPPTYSFRVDDPLDDVAIVAFLTTSVVIARLVSKLRKMAEDARFSVHRKLIDAEEREYTRIATELNEDINQRVALVAFGLDQLGELEHTPSEPVAEVMGHTRELSQRVSEIGADLHAISHRLRSSNLEYLGIESAAKTFCREFAAQRKVEIDFRSRDVPRHVPLEISFPLFRVLQEALLNSAKHSGERYFEVELFGTSKRARTEVMGPSNPIENVVIGVKENHSFDNYFGTFPGVNGASLPAAQDPPAGGDPRHVAWLERATGAVKQQYQEGDIPGYFAYARQFTLCDNYYTEVASQSEPNHLMLIAAASPVIDNESKSRTYQPDSPYDLRSLPQSSAAAGLTWKAYGDPTFVIAVERWSDGTEYHEGSVVEHHH